MLIVSLEGLKLLLVLLRDSLSHQRHFLLQPHFEISLTFIPSASQCLQQVFLIIDLYFQLPFFVPQNFVLFFQDFDFGLQIDDASCQTLYFCILLINNLVLLCFS